MSETNELMKRPRKDDELVIKRTLELFMPKVVKYLQPDWAESERPYVEKQLSDVLGQSHNDGYAMARELENRHYWESNRALMDLMNEGEYYRDKAYKEILEQWIKCYEITPSRSIGDEVATKIYDRKGEVGVITKFYLDSAKYGVRYSDMSESGCYLVSYEEVFDPVAVAV
jgi:hypothetical protein